MMFLAADFDPIAAMAAGGGPMNANPAAAQAVGVGEQSLRKWHARLAPKPAPCGEDATQEELREEIKRLRRELRRAELEREILKKATAYFAKESL